MVLDQAMPDLGTDKRLEPYKGITVTFRKPLENTYDYRGQFFVTASKLLRMMPLYCSTFELIPEFTENGRIHYHGKYKPKDSKNGLKLLQQLRQQCGFCKIEHTLKHADKWNDYMRKGLKDTQDLVLFPDIILNDTTQITVLQEKNLQIQQVLKSHSGSLEESNITLSFI